MALCGALRQYKVAAGTIDLKPISLHHALQQARPVPNLGFGVVFGHFTTVVTTPVCLENYGKNIRTRDCYNAFHKLIDWVDARSNRYDALFFPISSYESCQVIITTVKDQAEAIMKPVLLATTTEVVKYWLIMNTFDGLIQSCVNTGGLGGENRIQNVLIKIKRISPLEAPARTAARGQASAETASHLQAHEAGTSQSSRLQTDARAAARLPLPAIRDAVDRPSLPLLIPASRAPPDTQNPTPRPPIPVPVHPISVASSDPLALLLDAAAWLETGKSP